MGKDLEGIALALAVEGVTSKRLAEVASVPWRTARRIIRKMADKGMLVDAGPEQSTRGRKARVWRAG